MLVLAMQFSRSAARTADRARSGSSAGASSAERADEAGARRGVEGRLPQNGTEDNDQPARAQLEEDESYDRRAAERPTRPVHQLGVVRTGQDECLPTIETMTP